MTRSDQDHSRHISPDGEQEEKDVLFGQDEEVEGDKDVAEEVAYEARFADGGGVSSVSGSPPHGFEGGEEAKVRMKRTPKEPSALARANHEAHHMPYRDWCEDCVSGRGVADPHVSTKAKQDAEERENREVCMDYFSRMERKAEAQRGLRSEVEDVVQLYHWLCHRKAFPSCG